VVTRRDLSEGQQAVQSVHAAIQFCFDHFELAQEWHNISKYLALVSVENEDELIKLIGKCESREIKYSVFLEPDIGNEITAITIEPTERGRKIISNLPLTLTK
jgi:peptidyl-tRNA hydrolase